MQSDDPIGLPFAFLEHGMDDAAGARACGRTAAKYSFEARLTSTSSPWSARSWVSVAEMESPRKS